jgi:5-methylcytosine-specific restriction endonuclease McrA
VSTRFFVDERRESGGIRLTEQLRRMVASSSALDLGEESEARWRLVETAWELGVSRSTIEHEREGELLTVKRRGRRVTVTSVRAALNGYQKGKCFYCFSSISTTEGADLADVDHFFPWALRAYLPGNIDGVWNLVLACQRCNRGAAGKSDLVPPLTFLERLHRRNEFLITSHHPLRETMMLQTGAGSTERTSFLQSVYDAARLARIKHWDPPPAAAEAAF